jgi:predicted nucleotidyltransferase
VYLFGSVLDVGRFRLDSDIDLAVSELPTERYYEAWALAEEASGSDARLDLVRLEDAPAWLSEEVRIHGGSSRRPSPSPILTDPAEPQSASG